MSKLLSVWKAFRFSSVKKYTIIYCLLYVLIGLLFVTKIKTVHDSNIYFYINFGLADFIVYSYTYYGCLIVNMILALVMVIHIIHQDRIKKAFFVLFMFFNVVMFSTYVIRYNKYILEWFIYIGILIISTYPVIMSVKSSNIKK